LLPAEMAGVFRDVVEVIRRLVLFFFFFGASAGLLFMVFFSDAIFALTLWLTFVDGKSRPLYWTRFLQKFFRALFRQQREIFDLGSFPPGCVHRFLSHLPALEIASVLIPHIVFLLGGVFAVSLPGFFPALSYTVLATKRARSAI